MFVMLGALFYAQGVLGITFTSTRSGRANGFDDYFTFEAGHNKVLTGIYSYHNNDREDREWHYYTASGDGMTCSPGHFSGYSEYDRESNFKCPPNQALHTIEGTHDNHREDRIWRYKCCDITSGGKFQIHSVSRSGMLNFYDHEVDGKCGPHSVLTGIRSWHDNGPEDRRFQIYCGLVQETGRPQPVWQERSATGNLNGWDQTFQYSASGDHVIIGLQSQHHNQHEDRVWGAITARFPNQHVNYGPWSSYQNRYDEELNFECPANQVICGIGSEHDNNREDRLYRFRCCTIGNLKVAGKRWIGYSNDFDGNIHEECGRNEALVKVHSYHDNGPEDRIFDFYCGTLETDNDYDDCTKIEVIDVQVGTPSFGAAQVEKVDRYTVSLNFCGNALISGGTTLQIENTQSISKTEAIERTQSWEETFSFEHTVSLEVSYGFEVSGGVEGIADTSSSYGFSLGTSLTAGQSHTESSSQTRAEETTTEDISVTSTATEIEPAIYQWRELRATYTRQSVTVPVKMTAQCTRKDGTIRTAAVDSVVKAARHTAVTVEFLDRTAECPQSYYHNCECVTGLRSNYISRLGCQVHPFHPGHEGCYVFIGNNCGNGEGLGTNAPRVNVNICDDAKQCPQGRFYYDYPIDEFDFEWSYVPCGGDRYYPGDSKFTGAEVTDLVTIETNRHCFSQSNNGGTLSARRFRTQYQAVTACNRLNIMRPNTCYGVYDIGCDNDGSWYLCANNPAPAHADTSCVYRMQNQNPPRNVDVPIGPAGSNGEVVVWSPVSENSVNCPHHVDRNNWVNPDSYGDTFDVNQQGSKIAVKRTDSPGSGWGLNLIIRCDVNGGNQIGAAGVSNGGGTTDVVIGPGRDKTVTAPVANLQCPSVVNRDNWVTDDTYPDVFTIEVTGTSIKVTRTDQPGVAWGMNLIIRCNNPGTASTDSVDVVIGPGHDRTVTAPVANLVCPSVVNRDNWVTADTYPDVFTIEVNGLNIKVTRTDQPGHFWGMNLTIRCYKPSTGSVAPPPPPPPPPGAGSSSLVSVTKSGISSFEGRRLALGDESLDAPRVMTDAEIEAEFGTDVKNALD